MSIGLETKFNSAISEEEKEGKRGSQCLVVCTHATKILKV